MQTAPRSSSKKRLFITPLSAAIRTLLILTFIFSFHICAEQHDSAIVSGDTYFKKHNIGAAAGFVSGYGLSYRHWFENRHGYQITFTPVYYTDEYDQWKNANGHVSLGGLGLYKIKNSGFMNLIAYYGLHYNLTYTHEESNTPGNTIDRETTDQFLFFGGGPGFDFHFDHLTIDLMFGIAGRLQLPDKPGVQFTAEIAMYYSF
ncbi:MAG: hypothetical protein JW795_18905 [Chitinivibrionales bacterium]|nr:hypothetical protein [Chitinivibrionales bacterium]